MTIVWNDPVNLMSYVTYVFQKYFGYEKKKAEKLMLEVHKDGKSVGQPPAPARRWSATCRRCTSTASGPRWSRSRVSGFARHRRSGRVIATFTGFEADLLRSLASQLVELLRNEAAVPRDDVDPFEAMMDFSGPTTEPEDPVLARLFPTAYPDDEEAAAEFRRFTEGALRDGKAAGARSRSSTASRRPGCRPSSTEDGLMIDVELDEPAAETWLRSFTDLRLALATRLGVEEGDEDVLARAARRRPARAGPRHLRVGGLPPGDPGRGAQRRSRPRTAMTDDTSQKL